MAATCLAAGAAGLGASAPLEPVSFYTVDGTNLGVTFAGLDGSRALNTTMHTGASNLAIAGSDTSATGLAAGRPSTELGNNAVDRTGQSIAAIRLQ